MLKGLIKKYLEYSAINKGRHAGIWRRFCRPGLEDWTNYLRMHGGFQGIGSDCAINPSVVFTDPHLTKIGSNVRIAGGLVLGHDGSVNMINRALGTKFDAVGPVVIADNVFIGTGCILLPGVTIDSNVIIGAGSVVSGHVAGDGIYIGSPMRRIRTFEDHLKILQARNEQYPWKDLIEMRNGELDRSLETQLSDIRTNYFFGKHS